MVFVSRVFTIPVYNNRDTLRPVYMPYVMQISKVYIMHDTFVNLILSEFAFCSDLRFPLKVREKKRIYAPLIAALIAYGWKVDIDMIVTTAGLRATLPLRNLPEFTRLGIDKKKNREALQNALAETAEKHLALIIRQQIILRQTHKLNPPPPAPPPEPPPD
jgi:hypothetical protein